MQKAFPPSITVPQATSGRILNGGRIRDAFRAPDELELIVNLKAAQALGIGLPNAALFRADDILK